MQMPLVQKLLGQQKGKLGDQIATRLGGLNKANTKGPGMASLARGVTTNQIWDRNGGKRKERGQKGDNVPRVKVRGKKGKVGVRFFRRCSIHTEKEDRYQRERSRRRGRFTGQRGVQGGTGEEIAKRKPE